MRNCTNSSRVRLNSQTECRSRTPNTYTHLAVYFWPCTFPTRRPAPPQCELFDPANGQLAAVIRSLQIGERIRVAVEEQHVCSAGMPARPVVVAVGVEVVPVAVGHRFVAAEEHIGVGPAAGRGARGEGIDDDHFG